MKEATWGDCLFNKSAKSTTPDLMRSKSLKETAEERINLIEEIDVKNCNFVFEDYYTSLMELLQAITFRAGFNVSNHICLGFYIRDILKRDDLFRIFNDLRFKRNSLTYYGNRMDFETAKKAIDDCKKLVKEMRNLF